MPCKHACCPPQHSRVGSSMDAGAVNAVCGWIIIWMDTTALIGSGYCFVDLLFSAAAF